MTLTELAVVIAIIVIISAVAVFSSLQMFTSTTSAEVRQIAGDMMAIRQTAINDHQNYCVSFNAFNYTIYNNSCPGLAANLTERRAISSSFVAFYNTAATPDRWDPISTPINITFNAFSSTTFGGTIGCPGAATTCNVTIHYGEEGKTINFNEDTGYINVTL
jgi:type II secretory pathway pseudopilin PulG